MKLTALLKQITALPWPINEHGSVLSRKHQLRDKICLTGFALAQGSDTKEADANNLYVHHAANVLPELVVAASEFLNSELNYGGASLAMIERLQKALAAADEVKDHSEQLTPAEKPQTVTMT